MSRTCSPVQYVLAAVLAAVVVVSTIAVTTASQSGCATASKVGKVAADGVRIVLDCADDKIQPTLDDLEPAVDQILISGVNVRERLDALKPIGSSILGCALHRFILYAQGRYTPKSLGAAAAPNVTAGQAAAAAYLEANHWEILMYDAGAAGAVPSSL